MNAHIPGEVIRNPGNRSIRAIVVPGLGKRGTERGRREFIRPVTQVARSCSVPPNRDCRAFAAMVTSRSSVIVCADAVVVTDVGKVWEVKEFLMVVEVVVIVGVLVVGVVLVAAVVVAVVVEMEAEDSDNLENSPLTRMGSLLVIADPWV